MHCFITTKRAAILEKNKNSCKLKKIRPLDHMYIIPLTIVTLVYKGGNSMGLFTLLGLHWT